MGSKPCSYLTIITKSKGEPLEDLSSTITPGPGLTECLANGMGMGEDKGQREICVWGGDYILIYYPAI